MSSISQSATNKRRSRTLRRIVLVTMGGTGILGVVAILGVVCSARLSVTRRLESEATEVMALVDAIHEYREVHGQWPPKLDALMPTFVDSIDAPGWQYHPLGPPDDIAELSWQGPMHTKLGYVFSTARHVGDTGWYASSEGNPLHLHVEGISPAQDSRIHRRQ